MKKILAAIFLVFSFLWVAGDLFGSVTCVEFFAGNAENVGGDRTDDLLAYLGTLLEEQIIGDQELGRIAAGLEVGILVNPVIPAKASVNTAALLHRNEIQEYLDTTELDYEKILSWTKKKLLATQGVKVRRDETRIETEDLHHKMVFYPIPPGKFEMGEKGKQVSVELTHTTQMMSTLVTQKHWIDLMGENPSKFSGPDNPVENVTWWSAIYFANELSKKHGLKPAYDLSGVEFAGDASEGTLVGKGQLTINAPGGDIYLAEGYRLPTEAEQEYVRRNLGSATGDYYFGDNEAELKEHAWYQENSDGSTHPVAEHKPLMIGRHGFFDLLGNVFEWGHDYYGELKGGINPVGVANGSYRVIRGGSWGSSARDCRSAYRNFSGPGSRDGYVGFRLVRTLHLP